MEQSLTSAASDSSIGPGSVRLPGERVADGLEDFFVGREKDEAFFGDDLVAHTDGELAEAAFDQFSLHAGFALQQVRHTGGSRLIRRSDFAVANGDGVHA